MSLSLVFWILMLFWLIFGTYWRWPGTTPTGAAWAPIGNDLLLFILLLILGWHAFGAPLRP